MYTEQISYRRRTDSDLCGRSTPYVRIKYLRDTKPTEVQHWKLRRALCIALYVEYCTVFEQTFGTHVSHSTLKLERYVIQYGIEVLVFQNQIPSRKISWLLLEAWKGTKCTKTCRRVVIRTESFASLREIRLFQSSSGTCKAQLFANSSLLGVHVPLARQARVYQQLCVFHREHLLELILPQLGLFWRQVSSVSAVQR